MSGNGAGKEPLQEVTIKRVVAETPRFSARGVARFAALGAAGVVVIVAVLAVLTNVFESTNTYTDSDGKTVVESTFDLATAKFAVSVLLVVGALTVVAGFVVALADLVKSTTTTTTTTAPQIDTAHIDEAGPRGVTTASVGASGAAAMVVALGKFAGSLGTALKDLRAASALVLVGALMMVTGGAVAWNTIPGTDTNPTITETETTTTTVDPGDAPDPTDPTNETSDPPNETNDAPTTTS